MSKPTTLIDRVYQASFRNETQPGWKSNTQMREALRVARRFVLDDGMSDFLGILSTETFTPTIYNTAEKRLRLIENLRVSARLPFPTTWIEYNLRATKARIDEILGRGEVSPDEIPEREGWLLQQHPGIETAFVACLFNYDSKVMDEHGYDCWTFPVGYAWVADDESVIPWIPYKFLTKQLGVEVASSQIALGLQGYLTDRAAIVNPPLLDSKGYPIDQVGNLIHEWTGCLRRVWALLATITDLPTQVTEVRATKGFLGKRSYRRFLDHKTITLTIPREKYRKVARQLLAQAHRRGGPVMAHWRENWHRPLNPLCEHEFAADEKHKTCTRCEGQQSYIKAHERGDSSKGFVTHDYRVTHSEP